MGSFPNLSGRPPGSVDPDRLVIKTCRPHIASLLERALSNALMGDADSVVAVLNLYSAARSAKKAD